MDTQSYLLAHLPPTPNSKESKPLVLSYRIGSGGRLAYGDRPLQLSYTREETIVNNTQPQGITKTETQPQASQLNCSMWVSYFGGWAIKVENVFCGQSISDYDSETERVDRYFSGFKFDKGVGVWNGIWEQREQQQVFNSTFYYSRKVELALNLIEGTGQYFEHAYSSTAS